MENLEAVAALGGTAFIPPKSTTTGGAGGLFEKMFHYYQFRREEFLQHYHQRSNIVSVFSMMKRKFGDSVRSRNPVAMVKEALAKALCTTTPDPGCLMDMRELKGLEIAARCRVKFKDGAWLVPSQLGRGKYRVTLTVDSDRCECEDFGLTGKPCKDIHAARLVRERDHGGLPPAIDTDTIPKRPIDKQDWPAYNLPQSFCSANVRISLARVPRS